MTDMSVSAPPPAGAAVGRESGPDELLAALLSDPDARRDPYPLYAALREHVPVHRSSLGFVVCTTYDDCQEVLRDPRFGKSTRDPVEILASRAGDGDLSPELLGRLAPRRSLLFLNPPDHTRLRGLVAKAFTPRTVERLRPAVAEIVDGLLRDIPDGEVVDVMDRLAFPLPVAVIGTMLGVPAADRPRFRRVVGDAAALLEPVLSPSELEAGLAAQEELEAYFRDLVAERRREPRDDLLSALVAARDGSDLLSEDELVSTAILLFGAGFETTTNLIGNGLLALLRHPDQLALLRAEPGRVRGAVEEVLRYDSPVQFDAREAFEDTVLGGVAVGRGDHVVTLIGAANRDPRRFSDPDRFDVLRDEGPPLSFAAGIHYCLGAALARAEGQTVLEGVLEHFDELELADDEPAWRPRATLRGLVALPVRFRRRQGTASRTE